MTEQPTTAPLAVAPLLLDARQAAALVKMAEEAPTWTAPANATTTAQSPADGKAEQADEKPAQAEAIVRLALAGFRLGLTEGNDAFAGPSDESLGATVAESVPK